MSTGYLNLFFVSVLATSYAQSRSKSLSRNNANERTSAISSLISGVGIALSKAATFGLREEAVELFVVVNCRRLQWGRGF